MRVEHKKAAETSWFKFENPEFDVSVEFPLAPIQMTIEIPDHNSAPAGILNTFSAPTENAAYILAVFKSPALMEPLERAQFKLFFQKVIIAHLFDQPKRLLQQHHLVAESVTHNAHEGLKFTYTYNDHGTERKLEGVAFLTNQTLYCLFGAFTDEENEAVLARFTGSLSLL